MTAALQLFQSRLQRVLNHIDENADRPLDLEGLSDVASISKFHFHRQFSAFVGIPVHRYVQLVRMKRASWRLVYRKDAVTDIALDAGFESTDGFARAFRQLFGQSPTEFRDNPAWLENFESLDLVRARFMKSTYTASDVEVVEVPEIRVAVMPHRGDPAHFGKTIRRFIAWRRVVGLSPAVSATFNVFHSDPRTVAPGDYRLDLCAATNGSIAPIDAGVVPGVIPAGRCARLRVIGSGDDLESPALFLYRDWLPGSGEETRDFPLYCQRVRFFPDVPEHEAVTDLFLPLL